MSISALRKIQGKCYSVSTVRDVSPGHSKQNHSTDSGPKVASNIEETTLPSGLRVLSVDRASPILSLSLFVKAGSRYETRSTSGATHFLKYFAGQNNSMKSGLRLVRDLEHYGSTVDVSFDREYIGYHIALARYEKIEVQIAAETLRFILSPLLQEYEVDRLRDVVRLDSETQDVTRQLLESAHAVAFRDQGLGLPLFAPQSSVESLDPRHLQRHLANNFLSKNMTIVGTGLPHETLCRIVGILFSREFNHGAQNFPELARLGSLDVESPPIQESRWVGGEMRHAGLGGTNVLVAYPGAARNSKEEAALTIAKSHLNHLKLEGLCCSGAHYLPYSDTGLFGFQGSAPEGFGLQTYKQLKEAMKRLGNISKDDFEMARTFALTHHLHKVEDVSFLAKNISLYGKLNQSQEISSVNLNDFKNIVSRFVGSNSVVISSGDVRGIYRD